MTMFDDIIKDKAGQHRAPVPPDAWDNIIKKKQRRRFAFWWFALVVLLGSGTAYWSNNANQAAEKKLAQVQPGDAIKQNDNSVRVFDAQEKNRNADQYNTTATAIGTNQEKEIVQPIKPAEPVSVQPKKIATGHEFFAKAHNQSKEKSSTKLLTDTENSLNTSNKQKQRSSREIAAGKIDLTNENSQQKNKPVKKTLTDEDEHELFAQQKISGKSKSKTRVTTSQVVAEETGIDEMIEKNIEDNADKPLVQANQKKSIAKTLNETVRINKKEDTAAMTGAKNILVNSDIKKNTADTLSQKVRRPAAIRKIKQNSWFVEAGVTPLFPLENSDHFQQFTRSLFVNNTLTEFTGSLVSTKIDASVAFSLVLKKRIGKKAAIGAGLQYLQLAEHLVVDGDEKSTTFELVQRLVNGPAGPQLVTDTVQSVSIGKRTITATNRYQLLTLPVLLEYNLIHGRKWSVGAAGAAYLNISSEYQNEVNRNAAAPLLNRDQSQTGFGLDLSLGCRVARMVSGKLEIFALPAFRWNVSQYNFKNNLVNKSIRQAGLHFGLSYKLD